MDKFPSEQGRDAVFRLVNLSADESRGRTCSCSVDRFEIKGNRRPPPPP